MASLARIVISKSIHEGVPNGREPSDEQGFAQGNPNIVDGEVATTEVLRIKILDCLDALQMLAKSLVQHLPRPVAKSRSTFPAARRDGFPYVYRQRPYPSAITLGDYAISRKFACVIDGVNTRSNEWLKFRDGLNRTSQ